MSTGGRLVVATRNPGKVRELERLLGGLGLELVSAADLGLPEVDETGETFEANAILKAEACMQASGLPALGDDSGLEVDALGGAPGVRSARYAGPAADARANVEKLLRALEGVPAAERTARFRCVLALARPDGQRLLATGTCEGAIALGPRGEGGFGYDPVFLVGDRTLAEVTDAEKDARSHRGRACAELVRRFRG